MNIGLVVLFGQALQITLVVDNGNLLVCTRNDGATKKRKSTITMMRTTIPYSFPCRDKIHSSPQMVARWLSVGD